jgi:hypothetical protein
MDFIEGLPQSGTANAILVVIDKFSKFSHFIPLRHPFTATSVAKLFLDHVYQLHGLPQVIVTDRDRIFTHHFWQQLFKLVGVDLWMSTSPNRWPDRAFESMLRDIFALFCPCLPDKVDQLASFSRVLVQHEFPLSIGSYTIHSPLWV